MGTYSVYATDTGRLAGVVHQCVAHDLPALLRPGTAAVAGRHDHRTSIVDLRTGCVVPWTPPAAEQLAALQRQRIIATQQQIAAQEAQQARPLRELALAAAIGQPPPAAAVAAVARINDAIAVLRATRAAVQACTTVAELEALCP